MTTRRFADVSVGEVLPELVVDITTTRIVAGALASRDYQDVHHDKDVAVARGSRDLFMNILTSNGWVGRYVTDWTGPDAVLRKVSLRLGAPNYPGDTMRMTGEVAARHEGNVVEVKVRGTNSMGDHIIATVLVALP